MEVIADSLERTDSAAQSEFRLNKVLATPSVRKMAMEYKVILNYFVFILGESFFTYLL